MYQDYCLAFLPAPITRPLPLGKLTGMNEISEKLTLPEACRSDHVVVQKVTATANLGRVPCGAADEYRCGNLSDRRTWMLGVLSAELSPFLTE